MSSRIIDVEKKVFRKGAPGAYLLFLSPRSANQRCTT